MKKGTRLGEIEGGKEMPLVVDFPQVPPVPINGIIIIASTTQGEATPIGPLGQRSRPKRDQNSRGQAINLAVARKQNF